jgi:hypothetical protein
MDPTDYGAVLPRNLGERAAMEEDPIGFRSRNRFWFEAQTAQDLGGDSDGPAR